MRLAFASLLILGSVSSAFGQACPSPGCANPVTSTQLAAATTQTYSTQTGAYTFATSDCPASLTSQIKYTGTTAVNWTVPTGLPLGCHISVLQTAGTGPLVSIIAGTGETPEVASAMSATGTSAPANATSGPGAGVTVIIDSASTYHVAPAAR